MATNYNLIAGQPGDTPAVQRPRIALRAHDALPWLMLPDGVPLQMLMDTAPVRVPNTRPWFHGVVSQRGNLLPVFDLGHWAGLGPLDHGRSEALLVAVGQGAHACALFCTATPTLAIALGELPPAQHADAGALTPYLGKTFASANGPIRTFDVLGWFTAAAQEVTGSSVIYNAG